MNNVFTRAIVSLSGAALVFYGAMLQISNPIVECPGHNATVWGLILCASFWIMLSYEE